MIRVCLVTAFLFASSTGFAETINEERFSLSAGVFLTDRDTKVRLDGSRGRGTATTLEDDLGLDRTSTVFRIDGYFRFNARHRADFSVFDLSRSSSKRIDKDIQWGDTLFAIDSRIESTFDLTIYKAAYTYSFVERDGGYLGATLGLYVADSRVRLVDADLGQTDARSLTAPFPVIGLRGERKLSEKWTFRASAELFGLEYNDYEGTLFDLYAVADYALSNRFAVGFGLNGVWLNVRARKSEFDGRLDWDYAGALLFVKFDF